MSITDAFDLIEDGRGRWDIQLHDSLTIVGRIIRTADDGFELYDWLDRPLGNFPTTEDALCDFLGEGSRVAGSQQAA